MGMVFNPVYNWGSSAKISINMRNKTFVQGKLPIKAELEVGVEARNLTG